MNFLLETLKIDSSHPFRERVSREDLALSLYSSYQSLTQNENNNATAANPNNTGLINNLYNSDKIFRWTRLIRILSKRLPRWLISNKNIVLFYVDKIEEYSKEALKLRDLDSMTEVQLKDQFQIILKIIVSYCTYEKNNVEFVFILHKMSLLKVNNDFGFLKRFFKYTIPKEYSMESQKKIFLGFLDMIRNREEQELLRQTSLNLILPILSTIFKEKKDVLLLNGETFDIIKEKIKYIQTNRPPAYVYMEMTLLLDYIVSRMNLTRNDDKVFEFLNVDVLHFSWKNISHPRENSKQLKN